MGYGSYDAEAHRAATASRANLGVAQVFKESRCHPSMSPEGLRVRESRDSEAHPESVSIVFALDVSGSMGEIPHQLATRTLPTFMESVMTVLPHPQVMFIAFGNAFADGSPLQVGQFESESALMDTWLSRIHLEGGGGGLGESYDLAMYVAARHTAMDCLEKRKKKGYFFMTGDEVPFVAVDKNNVSRLLGAHIEANIEIHDIAAELLRSFEVFFLVPDAERAAKFNTGPTWTQLLRERAIVLDRAEDTAVACALLVGITERALVDRAAIEAQLESRLGRTGEARDRVVRAVLPYAEALARGPIGAPQKLGVQKVTGFTG